MVVETRKRIDIRSTRGEGPDVKLGGGVDESMVGGRGRGRGVECGGGGKLEGRRGRRRSGRRHARRRTRRRRGWLAAARCSMLDARCSLLDARYSLLATRHSPLADSPRISGADGQDLAGFAQSQRQISARPRAKRERRPVRERTPLCPHVPWPSGADSPRPGATRPSMLCPSRAHIARHTVSLARSSPSPSQPQRTTRARRRRPPAHTRSSRSSCAHGRAHSDARAHCKIGSPCAVSTHPNEATDVIERYHSQQTPARTERQVHLLGRRTLALPPAALSPQPSTPALPSSARASLTRTLPRPDISTNVRSQKNNLRFGHPSALSGGTSRAALNTHHSACCRARLPGQACPATHAISSLSGSLPEPAS
ncbi:hypothetical protein BC628DRAFT_881224 [Trametes gibbosa]|nr:hypothetical protein BC628DRAFT_881224 [Trametes gibbosa]